MNRLSVKLLKGLLEEAEIPRKEIVGMYGGGFKPPTVGHLEVVKRALDENPQIDRMIVLVGSGERDSITQSESLAIWRIYQKYLPKKVEVQPAPEGKAPISAVYSYAKNNPEKDIYWFLGAREGNEEDSLDIIKRTKSLQSGNYPNVTVKKIITGGTVSGTKTRKALLARDKETFIQSLPDIPEINQIWNMLSDTMGINEEKNPIQPNYKLLAEKGACVYHEGKKLFLKRKKFYDVKEIIENRYNLEDKQGRQFWITKSDMNNKWSKYDPEELKKGIEVEKEHTDDPKIAMKIALDHLKEDPKYYTKLATLGLEERLSFKVDNFDEKEVDAIEDFADNKMRPDIDIDLSGQHFFDRLNDPRNYPDIEPYEVEDFFDKLADKKEEFIEFLKKYKEVVAKDRETNINIPFMKIANRAIAKTIMRKKNFLSSTPILPLQEGRYDQEVLTQSRFILNLFKSTLGEPYKSEDFEFEGNVEDVYYDLQLEFVPTDFDTLGPIPYIINAAGDGDSIEIIINYNPDAFPENYNKLNAEIKDALRHELEHVGQYNFPKGVIPRDIGDPPIFDYLTTDFEIPAHVQGLYKTAKTKKITLNQAIDDFLDERAEELSAKEEAQIKKIWLDWAKKNLPAAQITEADPKKGTGKKPKGSERRLYTDEDPSDTVGIKFKTKEDIVDTLNKTSFKNKSHARQSQVINLIHQRVRAAYGKAKDPDTKARLKRGLDYITSRKEASKEKTKRLQKLDELILEVVPKDVIDSFDIQDTLVQDVWDGEKLKPEIRKKLLKIAKDFFDSLDLPPGVKLKDIKLTGSLANYNWSKFSDVDLHLILDYADVDDDEEFVRNYFMAKKSIWNDAHDITIYGFPVEVYVENEGESHTASGLYSVLKDKWIVVPKKQEVMIDKDDITTKAEGYMSELESIQKLYNDGEYEKVIDKVDKIKERLRDMRSSGLEKGGEYSVENLAFKVLRRSDFIGQLNDLKSKSYDTMMTLKENIDTNSLNPNILSLTQYMGSNGLNLKPYPKVKFIKNDKENAEDLLGKTAYYDPNAKLIALYTLNRHPKDVLRSYAHELVHHHQNLNNTLQPFQTQNTNEDGDLEQIEREAYENGNILFRNWEDSIKNQ